jgi:hypothetical protein
MAGLHRADLADARGHRRGNMNILASRFGNFTVQAADIPRDNVIFGDRIYPAAHLASYQEDL